MIYAYNIETGEYKMTIPFEDEVKEGTTDIKPPAQKEGKVAVFNQEKNKWSSVNDYRFTHKMVKDNVIYDIENFGNIPEGYTLVTNEEAEELLEQQRIAKLHLTRGDVFRGLLQAKGITRAQIRTMIEQMPEETDEQKLAKEMALIDFDEALDFYRGVAIIDTLGEALGISSEQMTRFFETGDYKELVSNETTVE